MDSYVPSELFQLTKGTWDELTSYHFNRKIIKHSFCPTCGVVLTSAFMNTTAVNARTVDGVDVNKLDVLQHDGKTLL